jgi:hypothetical protein
MKQTTIVNYTDLLAYAETIGIDWNNAINIMEADRVRPRYDMGNQLEIYPGIGKSYGWSEDSCKIVDGFMEKNELKSATLIND